MAIQPPVILVHAITGSVLRDLYRVPPEVVWDPGITLFRWEGIKEFSRLAMHPSDLRYEARQPAQIAASHPVSLAYGELIEALRDGLPEKADRPVPVFPFAYDWRQDNLRTAASLGDFIREMIDRTNLLKHYAGQCTAVDLVGHSMGGLVIAACLAKGHHLSQGVPLVRRVVTLGTPFQGAVDAMAKMATGESELVGSPRHAERTTARMTPALYHLLPFFEGALKDPPRPGPRPAFDPDNWQDSIVESLAESIRLFAVGAPKSAAARNEEARQFLAERLAAARDFLALVNGLKPAKALLEPADGGHPGWLVLVGLDEKTRYQARIETTAKGNRFSFDAEEEEYRGDDKGKTADEVRAWRLRLGDGVVPIAGALPRWVDRASVVGVVEKDFGGFLGFGENFPLRKAVSLHVALPLMNLVQRWIVSFFRGRRWGDLWGRPLPDVPRNDWQSPVPKAEAR